MKISISYLFFIMRNGYPPAFEGDMQTFKEMHELGFHYLEMEGLGREHSDMVRKNLSAYKQVMEDYNIHIHNFCIVDPDLVSLDDAARHAAYDNFKRTAELGMNFSPETFHLASYAPPVEYLGRTPYQLDGGEYKLGSDSAIRIPDGFKWQKVWDTLVESCRFCASVMQDLGKTIIMEPRVGERICSVDSMIRLLHDVDMPNFKANFDTAHFSAQREDVCLALMKLEGQFANIHIADNNPVTLDHLPLGDGITDWKEFFRILMAMNYDGYLGLDLSAKSTEELTRGVVRSRDYILALADEMGFEVEW